MEPSSSGVLTRKTPVLGLLLEKVELEVIVYAVPTYGILVRWKVLKRSVQIMAELDINGATRSL